jgi:hypothetical protein
MEYVDRPPKLRHVYDAMLTVDVASNLSNARSNGGHGLPIRGFHAVLYELQLEPGMLTNRYGKSAHAFKTVAYPSHRLRQLVHFRIIQDFV